MYTVYCYEEQLTLRDCSDLKHYSIGCLQFETNFWFCSLLINPFKN